MLRSLAVCCLLLVSLPAAAESDLAQRVLTPTDKVRLSTFDSVRASAITKARQDGEAAEITKLDAILAGAPQSLRGEALAGNYRCRTAKLDGFAVLIVYDWFRCRIEEDDLGYKLVKETGSQRLTARFIDDSDTRMLVYGAGHYAYEDPRDYGSDAERDMVGYFFKAEGGRYRVEFPLPRFESRFDILELERR